VGALKNIADTPFFCGLPCIAARADCGTTSPMLFFDGIIRATHSTLTSSASRFDEADGVIHGLVHKHAERLTCTLPGMPQSPIERQDARSVGQIKGARAPTGLRPRA